MSNIQDYFEYILKKHGENADNPSIKLKIWLHLNLKMDSLELLTTETTKLLGSTENIITKDQNGENVPHLEITEVVLVNCNIVNNDYQ